MTNDLHAHVASGKTIYAVVLDTNGRAWNGVAFETIDGGNWTHYGLPLAEAAAGIYLADMPAAGRGVYSYLVYEQAGGSPATMDTLRGSGSIVWSGTAEMMPASTAQEWRDAMQLAPTDHGDTQAGSVDAKLDDILVDVHVTLPATWTYTLTSSVDDTPIADADVWVTTDVGGTNVIASGQTDQNGEVAFDLDPGTIYVWRQKSGWNFANPDTEVVS